jgi:tetratricopeptide (TPR) repeat protein
MITPTTSNETQNKDPNKTRLVILIISIIFCLLLLLIGLLTLLYVRSQNEAKIAMQLVSARQLIDQSKFNDAILVLNEVIASNPNNLEAYHLRSMAYGNSRSNNFSEQQAYFVNALHDLDKMIELQPANGNNYVNRDLIFRELASMAPDSASEFALYELANDNAEKAMELGVTSDYSYVYRHHARNLIESNHCAEGLKETRKIISQAQPGDPNMNNYNIYLTEAYMCLGDLDKALETAQLIACENPVISCQSMYLVEIYFQSGETEKALEILNRLIDLDPTYEAWRYFIRAAIYYEQGNKELALRDLETGDNYSWYSNGVYWYVKAKMAFDNGDDQNGMLYLQYAESTLDVSYTPLRQKILKELTERGGKPLTPSPQIPLATTPIP